MELEINFKRILEKIKKEEKTYTRIAVIGQPGAGKSSLINNLIGKKVAETGPETDVTKEEKEYEYNFMKIVDLPGYATSLFTFEKWLKKYPLKKYDALIYVCSGKLLEEDLKLFKEINNWIIYNTIPLFLVRTHSKSFESISDKEKVKQDILKNLNVSKKIEVYFVDCGREKEGISELDCAIKNAQIYEIWKERIVKNFENARDAYLCDSRYEAIEKIDTYRIMASANGINPFVGADLAVDVGIYFKMFSDIRNCYGISENDIKSFMMIPVAKKLAELLTKQGIMLFIKSFGVRFAAKSVLKYIPFAGQAVAAAISWKMAKYAGDDYNDECYDFAKKVMDKLINDKIKKL